MKKVIEFNNVSYIKNDKIILDTINLTVNLGEFVSIVGSDDCGKSSLIRTLLGIEKTSDGSINILGQDINKNKSEILKKIGVVFTNSSNTFITNKVSEELKFSLMNMNVSENEIESRIQEVATYLHIGHLLDCMPQSLSGGEMQLVSLGAALMLHPDILIVDESLDMIDAIMKDKILALLKKLHREKKMTIIHTTQDLEDTLYTDRIVLLGNGKIQLDETVKSAFTDDKIYREFGLSIPFMVELSKKLQYYDLVDKIEFDMDKLVNKLWK